MSQDRSRRGGTLVVAVLCFGAGAASAAMHSAGMGPVSFVPVSVMTVAGIWALLSGRA